MTGTGRLSPDERLLPSGDEAGTAPSERRFRPDVEGLRAVAVLLVVLYHASLPGLSGGFVGVDVFFVISGYVITGVLLRAQDSKGVVTIVGFYCRRIRRILPAATLVLIATTASAYLVLGVVYGDRTATDARWSAVFLANFHFASVGTDYFTSLQAPSPLQNFWSLAVEEQFYLVYPTAFFVLASIRTRVTLATRLAIALGAGIVVSFLLSVHQTATNPTVAYFSPFTRAWELALGALVAVGARWLLRIPRQLGPPLSWLGISGIVLSAFVFTRSTPYPGVAVAVPVVASALVIAAGVVAPARGAETLLGLPPLQWLGRISYSLYLWHWPILVIAAYAAGKPMLTFSQSLWWLVVAAAASVMTFFVLEQPVRHSRVLHSRRGVTILIGLGLVASTLVVASIEFVTHSGSGSVPSHPMAGPSVARLVAEAPGIQTLPPDLAPSLEQAPHDWGGPPGACWAALQISLPPCQFGDPNGTRTMVLLGDSHAGMWFDVINLIATTAHWKLVWVGQANCPAALLPVQNSPGIGIPGGRFTQCDQFHRFAIDRINQLRPDLIVVSQAIHADLRGKLYTPTEWGMGFVALIHELRVPSNRIVLLGEVPALPAGPACLSHHQTDVQRCSHVPRAYIVSYNDSEKAASASVGGHYLDVSAWFCSRTCTAVIGSYEVYMDVSHVTRTYSMFLASQLAASLRPWLRV